MKKVLSFALMALMMGYVFVSCDEEKLAPEDDKKPVVNNDSIPSDSTQTPADTTQTPVDTTQTPVDTLVSYTLSMSLSKADSVYLGTDTTNQYGDPTYPYYRQDICIDNFVLTHSFASWGLGDGFTYTSCTNDTTAGSSNLSAITKQGVSTNAYFTAYTGGALYGLAAEISFKDSAAYNAKECYVTNCVSAYLAMKEGNGGGFYVKPDWGEDDWFTLTITGYNGDDVTESVIVFLADGNDILNTWKKVDLTKLGKVTRIRFTLDSTDQGQWGMNTPAYFCLDQLTVTE